MPPEHDSLGLLRLAFDAAAHAVVVYSEDGIVLFANRQATTIFAYDAHEIVGLPIARLLADGPLPEHGPHVDDDAEPDGGQKSTGQPILGTRKDGVKVPLEISATFVQLGDSRYIVASIVDPTERLNLEARLAAATHEHLGFQRLVSDLAARFAGVSSDALDELIVTSLRQIGEALQLDRAVLWRWRIGEGNAVVTHSWLQDPQQSLPGPYPIATIPYVISALQAGEVIAFASLDDLPDPIDRETLAQSGTRSGLVLPVPHFTDDTVCGLGFCSMTMEREWVPAIVERLRLVTGVIGQALARRASQAALQTALDELHRLRKNPDAPSLERRRDAKPAGTSRLIISESATVRRALAQIEQVAPTSATVLLLGETGAGKEVFAQTVHDLSPRHRRPMVVVNCAAIPTALIESELFGRERGAYTGALSRQIGRFEAANQSTLFLDEIGELPADMQVKLLRVLEDHTIERLGSPQSIKIDVRIIAATHRDLEKAVREGAFRQDLFYRLNVFPVTVPPLRERIDDVPGLVWTFVDEFTRAFGKTIDSISRDSMEELQRYPWPGNVRELRNVVERAVILATGRQLVVPLPAATTTTVPQSAMTLATLEVEHIRSVLESTNWRVRGRGGAAERLGLKPTTLESRMARLGILRKRTP